jgi:tRNA G18 (ribose-2'-O)-methylase SpoU
MLAMTFIHERHKMPQRPESGKQLILAVPQLRSNVNLARIVRTAGACGISRMIVGGNGRIDASIARDALECVAIERHRSLLPVLVPLKASGISLVGLEQSTGSQCLYDYRFPDQTVLVIGHERLGIDEPILQLLDAVLEIPIYGRPRSHNVATATAMALYEFCRQRARADVPGT